VSLSVNNPIVAIEIDKIKMFKELKVWLLVGFNNDKVVIKKDAVFAPQIKSSSPAIKAIAPNSKLKILTPAENNALMSYVTNYEEWAREYEAMGAILDPEEDQAVKDLKEALGPNFREPFVKMEAQNVTDIEKALEQRAAGNKTNLRAFTATLNGPGGWERLGQIVAADMFNGNRDRFYPNLGRALDFRGHTLKMHVLVNPGNVFRVDATHGSQVGALDFVDPNCFFKDINEPLAVGEQRTGKKWPGRLLANKSDRKRLADEIVHDLELVLNPRKSMFSLKTKLKSGAADRLVTGMIEGAKQIKTKLEAKYNPNRWTQGTTDRYKILCEIK